MSQSTPAKPQKKEQPNSCDRSITKVWLLARVVCLFDLHVAVPESNRDDRSQTAQRAARRSNRSAEKEKRKRVNHAVTAESQGIVAQGNSNPYNTGQILSRLQMIRDPRHLADVEHSEESTAVSAQAEAKGIVNDERGI